MKLPFYLISVVIFLALTTTLSTPIGSQQRERIRYRQGLLDEEPYYHHKELTTPALIEYIGYAQALVNDSYLKPDETIQQIEEKLLEKISVNASSSELPQEEAKNVTSAPGPSEADNVTSNSVLGVDQHDVDAENYTSIHGNCSHCMKEFENGTGIKYMGCMCGLFETKLPSETDAPLTSKTFQNVSCHQLVSSEEICRKHCISMAESHNELKSDMICNYLPHAVRVEAHLQSKLCEDDAKWIYTGVSSADPICCHMGESVPC